MESFNKVLIDLAPSVFALKETKRKILDPSIKSSNLIKYQVFELKREKEKNEGGKGLAGGGLMIGGGLFQTFSGPGVFKCLMP